MRTRAANSLGSMIGTMLSGGPDTTSAMLQGKKLGADTLASQMLAYDRKGGGDLKNLQYTSLKGLGDNSTDADYIRAGQGDSSSIADALKVLAQRKLMNEAASAGRRGNDPLMNRLTLAQTGKTSYGPANAQGIITNIATGKANGTPLTTAIIGEKQAQAGERNSHAGLYDAQAKTEPYKRYSPLGGTGYVLDKANNTISAPPESRGIPDVNILAEQTGINPEFVGLAVKYSQDYGIDPLLTLSAMMQESGGRADALSSKGAQGLLQVMPGTAEEIAGQLGVSDYDMNNPENNIQFGTKYLADQLKKFGDPMTALAAYNAGPGAVKKYGGVPPFKETKNYVSKIGSNYRRLNGLARQSSQKTRMLSPEEIAQAGLDTTKHYQIDPKGKITAIGGGGVNVNVESSPQFGKIPSGMMMQKTENGYQLMPIPGGPQDLDQEQLIEKKKKQQELSNRAGNVVLQDLGRVIDLVKNEDITAPVTGITGSVSSYVPGTTRKDAENLIETIVANIGFDRLQQMREASPTGGALGAISERELSTLQAVLGNLKLDQSHDQLLENLNRLQQIYSDIQSKAVAYPNAGEYGFSAPKKQQATDDMSDEELIRMYSGG